jgi:hypothetical protein
MRTTLALLLASLCLVSASRAADDEEKAKKVAEQKSAALANWKALEFDKPATHESDHFFIVAPAAQEKKLKALAALLARYETTAAKALALDLKDAYPGKITVYLLPDDSHLPSFFRRVEKRRPERGATGTFMAAEDKLHAAASSDVRLGEMVADLLLQRKATVRAALPDWLLGGFGRATTYRLFPKEKTVLAEKKKVRALAKKVSASAIWEGSTEKDDTEALRGSLAEYLAYVGGAARFPKFASSFKPGERGESRTAEYAFKEAGISADKLNGLWKKWALR